MIAAFGAALLVAGCSGGADEANEAEANTADSIIEDATNDVTAVDGAADALDNAADAFDNMSMDANMTASPPDQDNSVRGNGIY